MNQMSRKLMGELILILMLCLLFPMLWVFNQRVNYRGVFDLDERLLLRTPNADRKSIYSVHQIIRDLRGAGIDVLLSPKIITSNEFTVVGRVLNLETGKLEVYEYETREQASKLTERLTDTKLHAYKNLVIVSSTDDATINGFLTELTSGKNI